MKPALHFFSLALAAASATAATDADFFGVCEHLTSLHSIVKPYDDRNGILDLCARDGVKWVRTDFHWSTAEPSRGTWNWTRFDNVMDSADARGVKILPILGYGSAYGGHNGDNNRYVGSDEMDGWCAYVSNVVTRYRGRISAVEVWNEPNLRLFWSGTTNQYVALLQRTYTAVKSIDPGITVVLGGIAGIDNMYLDGLYKLGAKDYFDVVSFHPYCYPNAPDDEWPNEWWYVSREKVYDNWLHTEYHYEYTYYGQLVGRITQMRNQMSENGDGSKPIWLTEIGWPTAGEGCVTEAQQAAYATNAMAIAKANGVEKFFLYEFAAMEQDPSDRESHFGVVHSDYSFKPAWNAVRDYIYKETHGGSADPYAAYTYLAWATTARHPPPSTRRGTGRTVPRRPPPRTTLSISATSTRRRSTRRRRPTPPPPSRGAR